MAITGLLKDFESPQPSFLPGQSGVSLEGFQGSGISGMLDGFEVPGEEAWGF